MEEGIVPGGVTLLNVQAALDNLGGSPGEQHGIAIVRRVLEAEPTMPVGIFSRQSTPNSQNKKAIKRKISLNGFFVFLTYPKSSLPPRVFLPIPAPRRNGNGAPRLESDRRGRIPALNLSAGFLYSGPICQDNEYDRVSDILAQMLAYF